MKSLKKNFVYNFILNIIKILFPLITFPYLMRTLEPVGIGKYNFANSIAKYFVMVSSLGIPMYGIREMSKLRNSKRKLNKTYTEIFSINFISRVFFFLLYCIYLIIFPIDNLLLSIVLGFSILLKIFLNDWLFKGMEDYKYITFRNISLKAIALILIFLTVKNKSDYIIYAIIAIISIDGAGIFNLIYAKKYVTFEFSNLNLMKHLKPIITMLSTSVMFLLFMDLDNIMLGYISGEKYVGFYMGAIKFPLIFIPIINSAGTVMIPRISFLFSKGNSNEIKRLLSKSLNLLLMFSLPIIFALIFMSENLINLILGNDYVDSILTLKILAPILIFKVLMNVFGIQILVSDNKEKELFIASFLGAIINISLNFYFIPLMQHNGSAIATLISDFSLVLILYYYIRKFYDIELFTINKLWYLSISTLIIPIVKIINIFTNSDIFILTFTFIIFSSIYFISLIYFVKDTVVLEVIDNLKKEVKRRINN